MKSQRLFKLNVYRVYRVRNRRTSRVRYVAEIQYTDHGDAGSQFWLDREITKRFKTPSAARASHVLVNMVLNPLASVSESRSKAWGIE